MATFDSFQQELSKRAPVAGLATTDLLELSEPLRMLIQKIARERLLTLPALAAELGLTVDKARQIGDLGVEKGLFLQREQEGQLVYQVRFAPTGSLSRAKASDRKSKLDLWKTIDGT